MAILARLVMLDHIRQRLADHNLPRESTTAISLHLEKLPNGILMGVIENWENHKDTIVKTILSDISEADREA